MEPCKIWIEKCEAARMIEDEFVTDNALRYLIGEKFLDYLEAAERLPDYRAEIPAFVAEIKTIFEPWQLAEFLKTARQSEPFDPDIYEDEDPEIIEMERQSDLRRSANDLLLVEQARGWLLEGEDG
jgi:hypothetical protein